MPLCGFSWRKIQFLAQGLVGSGLVLGACSPGFPGTGLLGLLDGIFQGFCRAKSRHAHGRYLHRFLRSRVHPGTGFAAQNPESPQIEYTDQTVFPIQGILKHPDMDFKAAAPVFFVIPAYVEFCR